MQMKAGVMGHHKAITSVIQADNRQPQTADVINVKTFQMKYAACLHSHLALLKAKQGQQISD